MACIFDIVVLLLCKMHALTYVLCLQKRLCCAAKKALSKIPVKSLKTEDRVRIFVEVNIIFELWLEFSQKNTQVWDKSKSY